MNKLLSQKSKKNCFTIFEKINKIINMKTKKILIKDLKNSKDRQIKLIKIYIVNLLSLNIFGDLYFIIQIQTHKMFYSKIKQLKMK